MAGSGRISVLVSREMQTLLTVTMGLDRAVAARLRRETKDAALPIIREEMRGRAETRLETRTLLDTARVAVTDSNVNLKSAQVGKLSSGTPVKRVAAIAEFGIHPTKKVTQRSRKGNKYTRKLGSVSRAPRRAGYVFFPSVRDAIPRVASLWIQTAYRTVAEEFEKGAG